MDEIVIAENGCAELYLSGRGVEDQYFQPTVLEKKPRLEDEKLRDKYQRDLGKFLSNITNIIDPDYFVLGGGLSKYPQLYDKVQDILEEKQFLKTCQSPKIHQHEISDSAGVLGAALLVEKFNL